MKIADKTVTHCQHVKMFKRAQSPPAQEKERVCPKQVTQEDDAERYDGLKFILDETIFAAYAKAEIRKTKTLMIASSDFVNTSKFFFWPELIMSAGFELDWMQSISMAIGVQRSFLIR